MGCGTTIKSSLKPSEEMLLVCPPITSNGIKDFGDTVEQLFTVTDMYINCAKRHNALVEYERKLNDNK